MLEALLFLALIILGVVIWKTGLHNMIPDMDQLADIVFER